MMRASDLERWEELCAAFDALVELDAGARAERLTAIGASDPAARRALEEMLEADANAGTRLGRIEAIFGAADPPTEPSADADVLKLVGRTIAHFRVTEPLASGGMGVVYRAIDTHLDRSVALKLPLPGQRLDRQVRERFLREARAAGALDHPNLCSIFESGETEDGQLFFAMPLYDGETLKARIARTGRLTSADALAIAVQIARGLHAAHRAGIVHRDLKPANVIILPDGGLKILDFGIARVSDVTLTGPHATLGTVSYMAPEQVRGEQLDGRTDLWALGVLLYEMLTGRRPFEGPHEIAIAHAIVHTNPARPSALRPEIWPELDAVVLGLLAKQPRNRRTSGEAVAAELSGLETLSVPSKARHWRAPFVGFVRRTPVWAATVALVVTAVGTAAWLFRSRDASGSTEPRLVAVLPFEGLSGRNDTDHLAIALADEIATQLSRLSAVAVPLERSALEYTGSGQPAPPIAGVHADAVVRGRVRRTGDQVRLEIELHDVSRKRAVWTRQYSGPVSTVLALQQEATRGIVAALQLDLTRSERAVLVHVPTPSAEAYDLYLRGRAAQIGTASGDVRLPQSLESLQRAQSFYARARESDPAFAAARARLALLHLVLARYERTSARSDQARLEAEAALRIEPAIPQAHEALALYWMLLGERMNAVRELEQALAARPNAPHLHVFLGANLRQLGRWEEAVNAFERASRFDPRNRPVHYQAALTYSRLRRYEEAIAHWDRVIAMDTAGDAFPQIIRGYAYLRLGNVDSLDAAISRIPLGRDAGGMTTYARYTVHRVRRRHAELLASLDSARFAISSDSLLYVPVALMRAQTLERMGDAAGARSNYDAARALLVDSVATHPKDPRMRVALGLAYAGLLRRADAMREARTATELAPVSANSPVATASMGGAVEIYAQLGEADAAFELLELLFSMPAGREISVPLLRLDPIYDRLRSDPRFAALIGRFSRN